MWYMHTVEYYTATKEIIFDKMDGPWRDYAGTSEIEKDENCNFTFVWNQKNIHKNWPHSSREQWLQGQGIGRGKMGECGQNIQPSSYKVSNPWKHNVQHVCYS